MPDINRRTLLSTDMTAAPDVRLPDKDVDRSHDVGLGGDGSLQVDVHGHTFGLTTGGASKDEGGMMTTLSYEH